MSDQEDDASPKLVPIRDLKVDPTAEDLIDSPAMEPYVKLALAVMGHKDAGPAVKEITALPLEKRYTWRVASALNGGQSLPSNADGTPQNPSTFINNWLQQNCGANPQ